MAARCFVCGGKRSHPTHLRAVAGVNWHEYQDSSQGGMKPVSDGRRAYQSSQQHKDAYAAVDASPCVFEAAGAPNPCWGPIEPHHTLSRGRAGGLERAERIAPVASACHGHNLWVSQDAEGIAFGESHTFHHTDGREWPLLMTTAMAREIEEAASSTSTANEGV